MKRTLAIPFLFSCSIASANTTLEEVIVNADFYRNNLANTAASISVIGEQQLIDRKAIHLEDVLNIIPNMNFSSGASRGRFIQIRGIGERSQFVDPINPSVGLIIDGIDFTGLGGAASTLDMAQVEVFRGPQGTLYGANALAGLINMVSVDPAANSGYARINVGQYNTREYSQAVSGQFSENVGMRLAFSKSQSDGYIENTYLDRDDTNNIDETTIRHKFQWQLSNDASLKLTSYYFDADNGYDAFSLDNTRETLSDEPGHDRVTTRAVSLQFDYTGFENIEWQSVVSTANSDLEYGYDEDWSYRTICAIDDDCAFWQYSTTDNYERDNKNHSFDTRLVSDNEDGLSWVAGIYYRDQEVDLLRTYTNNDPTYGTFYGPIVDQEISLYSHNFQSQNIAAYGQFDIPLSENFILALGARAEKRDTDYKDSNDERVKNDENLWGGKLALEYRGFADKLVYALVSRGYKAGGHNVPGPEGPNGADLFDVIFDTEFMWNYELGYKASWFDGVVDSQISIFYQDREDVQVKQSVVTSRESGEVNGDCPCDFTDYITNAAAGSNYGMEIELVANLNENTRAWLSLGLLDTEYKKFDSRSHVDVDPDTGVAVDLDGRDQAHAPSYQGALGLDIDLTSSINWQIDVEAKDDFYLSPRHNITTKSYTLLNSRLSYHTEEWELALWGKNLTDEETIVRGFGSFGNDPRKFYETEAYFQYGAPRVIGVSASLNFK